MSPRRISQIFHNTSSASLCAPDAPSATVPDSPAKEPSSSTKLAEGSSSHAIDAQRDPRENIRELVREIMAELDDNPACEGLRRRFRKPLDTQSNSIVHTIGTCLPTPVHDFLKNVLNRVHSVTRRDDSAPSKSTSTGAPESFDPSPAVVQQDAPPAPAPAQPLPPVPSTSFEIASN